MKSPKSDGPDGSDGSHSPAVLSVLTGRGKSSYAGKEIPAGGCLGEAQRTLMAAAPKVPDVDLAQKLAGGAYEASLRDSRVRAVIGKWSECMRKKGFDYRSPLDPAGDPAFSGPVTPDEIRTALADIACKEGHQPGRSLVRRGGGLHRSAITERRDALDAVKGANQALLRAAKAVIESR